MNQRVSVEQLSDALPDLGIKGHIATGGQKDVFGCTFEGKDAVLKLIPAAPVKELRAEREIEAMGAVDCPNLVKVLTHDLLRVEIANREYVYFIEEFIEGFNLSDLIKEDWTYGKVIRLGRDLVCAVKELWTKQRVVHRDIKPANIRIRSTGEAVLLDVGMGRHIDRSALTPLFTVPGTPGYWAPEQVTGSGRDLDFRSDLFLIGICLYEVIAKTNPFTYEADEDEYLERLLTCRIPPLSAIDPQIPQHLADFIMGLLKPYKHLRPRTFPLVESLIEAAEEEVQCRS